MTHITKNHAITHTNFIFQRTHPMSFSYPRTFKQKLSIQIPAICTGEEGVGVVQKNN